MTQRIVRRDFLKTTAAGAAAIAAGVWSELPAAESKSALEKLNIAAIGTGGMAASDLEQLSGENIVALCDVDENTLGKAGEKYPRGEKYFDYRLMLELEQSRIDAVLVATPDHSHAPASVMAMKLGKHCYCQKPLTHSVYEARVMAETAAKQKVVTQMGTQIHGSENYRRVVEIIQSGAIGKVGEVHVVCNTVWGGGERPKEPSPIPSSLHWDLWLGPAPERPYAPGLYHPQNWRRWWDFGGGSMGDMGCHLTDLAFWALKLTAPVRVSAEGPPVHPETTPVGLSVTFEFAVEGQDAPLRLTWHDGNRVPKEVAGQPVPSFGVLFIGDKGRLFADYGSYRFFPEKDFEGYKPPAPSIPRSIGHWKEWIQACKTGGPTTCNFGYAGPLTETILLGNVAYRVGKPLEWDSAALKVTNVPEANALLKREYRAGWKL